MKNLEHWFTMHDPFEAPELPPRLVGLCEDRKIRTSRIRKIAGREVTTESGSVYVLGEPDPEFIAWLSSHDYPFDPENPIRLVDKLSHLPPPASPSNTIPTSGRRRAFTAASSARTIP